MSYRGADHYWANDAADHVAVFVPDNVSIEYINKLPVFNYKSKKETGVKRYLI